MWAGSSDSLLITEYWKCDEVGVTKEMSLPKNCDFCLAFAISHSLFSRESRLLYCELPNGEAYVSGNLSLTETQ